MSFHQTLPEICKFVTTRTRTQEYLLGILGARCSESADQNHVLRHRCSHCVVLIAIAEYSNLCLLRPDVSEWIAFAMGKHFQHISIDTICKALGPRKTKVLPLFHAITSCDTTSSFLAKGKYSAWDAWNEYKEVTEAFLSQFWTSSSPR